MRLASHPRRSPDAAESGEITPRRYPSLHVTTLLLLIRHASTDTAGKRLTGWAPGIHLNERGRQQSVRLAERLVALPIRAVYSSTLERCVETASPVAAAKGLEVRPLD